MESRKGLIQWVTLILPSEMLKSALKVKTKENLKLKILCDNSIGHEFKPQIIKLRF